MMKGFFFAVAAIGFLFLLFISYRLFWPLDSKGEKLLLDIPPGQTFDKLAEELEKKHLIRSPRDIKILVRLFGHPALPRGEYELSSQMPLWTIFQHIKQGKEKSFLIRFPEGLNHYEMGELLKNHNWPATDRFLKEIWNKALIKKTLNQNLDSFEGYLFPDSYHLRKYMPATALIELMSRRFFEVYEKFSSLSLKNSFNRHQVVTLASLIEKETGQSAERPLIAGVFYNRLNLNMKLQTDPSILYALYLAKGFDIEKNIRKKDILFPSSYNTYVVKGLPPGPIANPGEQSLQAVFLPESSDYLYFVSRNDGSHKFSKSYTEHKKAVYEYQIKAFKK